MTYYVLGNEQTKEVPFFVGLTIWWGSGLGGGTQTTEKS